MKGPLKFQNFKILSMFLDPKLQKQTKEPSDLFYGEICGIKLSFSHSDSEFIQALFANPETR
jgi:hypothetical protein